MRRPQLVIALVFVALAACTKERRAVPPPPVPVRFDVQPLEGLAKLPLDVEVVAESGKRVPLSTLVAFRSLVVYLEADTRTRENRALTRWMRELAKPGKALGFRTVLLFEAGMDVGDIPGFLKARGIRRPVSCAVDADAQFARATGWAPRSAALVDEDGSIGVQWMRADEFDGRLGTSPGLNADLLFRAWEPPHDAPLVDAATREAGLALVRASAAATWDDDTIPATLQEKVKAAPLTGAVVAPVFVSVFREGDTERLRGEGMGATLGEALALATHDALRGVRGGEWAALGDALRFSVDLPGPTHALPTRDERSLWFLVEPGVDGIAVGEGEHRGVLLPDEVVTQGFLSPRVRPRTRKLERLFAEAARRAGMSEEAWKDEATPVARFRSTSFAQVSPSDPVTPLYRGNTLQEGLPGEADILQSMRLGGKWLISVGG